MPQDVVAPQHLPLRIGDRSPEVIVSFVLGNGGRTFTLRFASRHLLGLTEQERACRPHRKPLPERQGKRI
jgi:hypothetical protein